MYKYIPIHVKWNDISQTENKIVHAYDMNTM